MDKLGCKNEGPRWAHAYDDAGFPGKLLHDFRRTAGENEAMPSDIRSSEQRAVADRLAAYRAAPPTTAPVVPMKRVDGAAL